MLQGGNIWKKLAEEILIFWGNSPIHTSQISVATVNSYSFELLPDLHFFLDLILPDHYLLSKYLE